MAQLICDSCGTPVMAGQGLCSACGSLLSLPGQVREVSSEVDDGPETPHEVEDGSSSGADSPDGLAEGGADDGGGSASGRARATETGPEPSRKCATKDCDRAAIRGKRLCRRCFVNAPRGRTYTLLLARGVEIDVGDGESVGVGRSEAFCEFSTHLAADRFVSQQHAFFRSSAGQLFVRDVASLNGTRINGVKIEPEQETTVVSGDVIRLGGQVDVVVR